MYASQCARALPEICVAAAQKAKLYCPGGADVQCILLGRPKSRGPVDGIGCGSIISIQGVRYMLAAHMSGSIWLTCAHRALWQKVQECDLAKDDFTEIDISEMGSNSRKRIDEQNYMRQKCSKGVCCPPRHPRPFGLHEAFMAHGSRLMAHGQGGPGH